jgi:hypothetical protein
MRFLTLSKDGGPESTVWAYTLIEWKAAFSVVLLRFEDGSRDAYHSHAFNAVSWVLSGVLKENVAPMRGKHVHWETCHTHTASIRPIVTRRSTMHKVVSVGRTWVLSVRGVGARTLTHGRRVVEPTRQRSSCP